MTNTNMKPNRLINNPNSLQTHTAIGATEQSAVTPSSFESRQAQDASRKFIKSYRDSMLGSRYGVRGSLKVANRSQNVQLQQSAGKATPPPGNRQAFNSQGGHHFSEPSGRSYNPYA